MNVNVELCIVMASLLVGEYGLMKGGCCPDDDEGERPPPAEAPSSPVVGTNVGGLPVGLTVGLFVGSGVGHTGSGPHVT